MWLVCPRSVLKQFAAVRWDFSTTPWTVAVVHETFVTFEERQYVNELDYVIEKQQLVIAERAITYRC